MLDGYPMARNGEAGKALGAAFFVSAIGGVIGALILSVSVPIFQPLVLTFGLSEFLAMGILGLSMVAVLTGKKLMEMPAGHYAHHPYDAVRKDGRLVGFSTYPVYSANQRAWISLATIEPSAALGSGVEILRGEKDGGTAKPRVERHRQMTVKTVVQPWPIHEGSRLNYRKSA